MKKIEVLITILFALSAMFLAFEQDRLIKSQELILTDSVQFQKIIFAQNILIQSYLNHLDNYNSFDAIQYVTDVDPELIQMAKEGYLNLSKIKDDLNYYSLIVNQSQEVFLNNDKLIKKYKSQKDIFFWTACLTFTFGAILSLYIIKRAKLDKNIF